MEVMVVDFVNKILVSKEKITNEGALSEIGINSDEVFKAVVPSGLPNAARVICAYDVKRKSVTGKDVSYVKIVEETYDDISSEVPSDQFAIIIESYVFEELCRSWYNDKKGGL